ncbi:hypothetical protein QL285_007405 [Trifolium repens]|nr:hypothetical protein QL285_007405 [Trifolium repens]
MEFSFYHFVLERRLGTNREPILEQLQVFCIVILHGGGEPFVDILLINDNQFVRDPIVFCSINSTLWQMLVYWYGSGAFHKGPGTDNELGFRAPGAGLETLKITPAGPLPQSGRPLDLLI